MRPTDLDTLLARAGVRFDTDELQPGTADETRTQVAVEAATAEGPEYLVTLPGH